MFKSRYSPESLSLVEKTMELKQTEDDLQSHGGGRQNKKNKYKKSKKSKKISRGY